MLACVSLTREPLFARRPHKRLQLMAMQFPVALHVPASYLLSLCACVPGRHEAARALPRSFPTQCAITFGCTARKRSGMRACAFVRTSAYADTHMHVRRRV